MHTARRISALERTNPRTHRIFVRAFLQTPEEEIEAARTPPRKMGFPRAFARNPRLLRHRRPEKHYESNSLCVLMRTWELQRGDLIQAST